MIILHVFGFPNRISPYTYKSLFYISGIPIEEHLATGSSIVVHIFLFISGYGLYLQGEQSYKKIFNRLKNLYIEYWSVFIVFIPIGYYLGIYKFNLSEFLKNFVGIVTSYNAEWWFIRAYVIYMLVYPMSRKIVMKYPKLSLIGAMGITGSGMILGKLIRDGIIGSSLFLGILASAMEYFYPFVCGMIIAELFLFDRLVKSIKKKNISNTLLFILLVIFICWIEEFSYIRHAFNFIVVPLFIEYV